MLAVGRCQCRKITMFFPCGVLGQLEVKPYGATRQGQESYVWASSKMR